MRPQTTTMTAGMAQHRIRMDGLDIIVLDADVEPAVMAVEADFDEDRDGGGGHGRLPCGRPRSCVK